MPLRQFCSRGHDTFITGRNKQYGCKACVNENQRKRRAIRPDPPLSPDKRQHKLEVSKKWRNSPRGRALNKISHTRAKKEYLLWYGTLKAGKCCIQCGESDYRCLDWHHRDPSTKRFGVGSLMCRNAPKDVVLEEIVKCDLLCSNCHRKLEPMPWYVNP